MAISFSKLVYMSRYMGWLMRHPLNRGHPFRTLGRYAGWHLGSRLLRHPVIYPFVNDLRIHLGTGFWGATGVVHFGLEEYGDMAFCAHFLRPDDLFVDIGTCFGTYTLLAAGVGGARVISFEPNPTTASWLQQNIRLNQLESWVEVRQRAVGSKPGRARFTDHLRGANHIVADTALQEAATIEVAVTTLDEELRGLAPMMLKIDVEGYEQEVLDGAAGILKADTLLAVLVEDVGLRRRYHSASDIHATMLGFGFRSYRYLPESRQLQDLQEQPNLSDGNTLYLRRPELVRERLATARSFRIRDRQI